MIVLDASAALSALFNDGPAWELRDNVSAYDAGYVALAEALGCALLTVDGRLAAAQGVRCPVTVIR